MRLLFLGTAVAATYMGPLALRGRQAAGLYAPRCASATCLAQPEQQETEAVPSQPFPTADTPPSAVLAAQLEALRAGSVPRTFSLFSRARRLQIEEAARRDVREFTVQPERVHTYLSTLLITSLSGLLVRS